MNTRCRKAQLFGAAANALSIPPGEYVRKNETQRNLSLIHIFINRLSQVSDNKPLQNEAKQNKKVVDRRR